MGKEIEIDRFNYNGLTYIVAYETIDSPFGKIPYILFYVTTKTGRKIRDKKTINKRENHFSVIDKTENPVALYRKITTIFTEFLKDYNYVCFSPHEDKSQVRVNIYDKYLINIGFKFLFLNDSWNYFYIRENIKIKKKQIKHYK